MYNEGDLKTPSSFSPWRRFRWRFCLLACLLVAVMAAGCAPRAASAPRAAVVAAVPQGTAARALQAAAQAYRQAGGVQVEVVALSAGGYASQVEAALLAGLDRYDLVLLPGDSLARWAGYRVILPLADPPGAGELAPWLPALRVGGDLYGLPTQPEADVIWYRADLLAAAGLEPPRTWEGFAQAARALHDPPARYGAAVAGGPLDAGSDFAALLPGFGGALFGPGGAPQVDSLPAAAALRWYAGLRAAGLVAPQAERHARADVVRLLGQGRAGLGIASLSAAAVLQDCAASPAVCAGGAPLLAWTWLPGDAATGSLSAWAVPRGAANPTAAAGFAAWLCGAEGAQAWAAAGGTPAHRAVLAGLDRPESALGRVEAFRPAFPPTAAADLVWRAVHAAAHAALAGEQAPAAALREAQRQVVRAVRRFNEEEGEWKENRE